MTTPTRSLPQGVEVRKFTDGLFRACERREDQFADEMLTPGYPTEAAATAAFWAWHDGQPENRVTWFCEKCGKTGSVPKAEAVRGIAHDGCPYFALRCPPENQAKAEPPPADTGEYKRGVEDGKKQAFDQMSERLDELMEACRAACKYEHQSLPTATENALLDKVKEVRELRKQVAYLTASVAALEGKAVPVQIVDVEQYHEEIDGKPSPGPRLIEGMNQLRDAVQNGTLDQLPTTIVARCGNKAVRYTREAADPACMDDESRAAASLKAHAPPEPVVGVAYERKNARFPSEGDMWMLKPGGSVAFNWGSLDVPKWGDSQMSAADLAAKIRSGELVPVTGKEGA